MKSFNLREALAGEPVKLKNGVFGKGIQDIPSAQRDPLYKKVYSRWYNMLQRCYSANFHKDNPTYANVTMCEDWLTSFDNWENLEIDKDLLSGNYYSPQTCLLIPKNLNAFLTFSQKTNTNMIGVNYYTPKGQKEGVFRATISVKYKGKSSNKHLGHFSTPLEGHLAWLSAKIAQLDEYILVSVGNVKTTLQSLRDFMNNCLITKNEFCGLEHFRNNRSKIGMWKEPKLAQEGLFEKALKERLPLRYKGLDENYADVYVVAKSMSGSYILEWKDGKNLCVSILSNLPKFEWYLASEKPVKETGTVGLPKPFIPKRGAEYFSVSPNYSKPEVFYANDLDHPSIINGNCFKTEEDAQKWIDFMKSMKE